MLWPRVIVGVFFGRLSRLIGRRKARENAQAELTPSPPGLGSTELSPSVGLAFIPQSKRIERHRRKTQQMIFSTFSCVTPRTMAAAWIRQKFPEISKGANRISPSYVSPLPLGVRALKMFSYSPNWKLCRFLCMRKLHSAGGSAVLYGTLLAVSAPTGLCSSPARAQQTDPAAPVVVQPGAPGKPSKTLPPSTKGTLPPKSPADVEFMQGMIMHHSQAVEMTALIASHTENKDLRSLGARISSSQSDEIKFMRRWLAARGESLSMAAPGMPGMDMSRQPMALMPGMLTPEQMDALRKANGAEFDHLFLTGMIQHHDGALTMVKDLFETAGAGQDAEIFNFATDADNTQRAEIRIMQAMLEKKSSEEKR
jgi:uncharacterized protein (DUF305 family)